MIRYENDKPVVDETKTNNRLAHGFMHTLVDDKINYLLTKPYTMVCEDEKYLEAVQSTLGKRFQKKFAQLGTEASNKGIAWLHPYISSTGEFKMMKVPSEQCIPLWVDNDHEELQAMIRYYDVEVYEGKEKKIITKIEYHTPETVDFYEFREGRVILDAEKYLDDKNNYKGHFLIRDVPGSWDRVPFIPFKNNDFELPDLKFIKALVDNYDLTRSDISNLITDIQKAIFVLRGYGGQNLSEFMRDLSYYRAIKVDADEGAGADTLNPDLDITSAKEHYETLKKDIYDFGQGVDKSSDKLGNSPSGIALKFMYSGLDLKCNAMEDNFKWAFEQLLYFVNIYHDIVKLPVSDKEIKLIFNRDIAINESTVIQDCANSQGIISDETIISNHPWVDDVEEEIKKVKAEKQEKLKQQQEAFGMPNPRVDDDNEE